MTLNFNQWYEVPGLVYTYSQGCSAKTSGVGTAFPHQIKRETAPNSSNKVSIRLQEFPHWIFLFHCRLLTSNANLRVAGTSMRSHPCNLVQKGVGTPFPFHYTPAYLIV